MMIQEPTKNSDDFFTLIQKDEAVAAPVIEVGGDEIIFKDEQGNLKILRGNEVLDYEGSGTSSPSQESKAEIVEELKEADIFTPPQNLENDSQPLGQPLNLDQEVEAVVRNSELRFNSSEDEKRFRSIVKSRLRGIRNNLQTKESLQDPSIAGGMGFDDQITAKVLQLINQELQHFDNRHRAGVGSDQFLELQQEAEKILAEPIIKEAVEPIEPKPAYRPAVEVKPIEVAEPKPTPAPPVADAPMVNRPVVSEVGSRPKIEDVKFKPKLTGPVEEIRTMTLKDFRRLSPSPSTAIQKIIEKIATLEEESFAKKVQAIKAWKESEVNRIYLAIGDQSMEEHKPMAEVITERTGQGLPTLTEEELEAIFDLNKKLRY